SVIGFGDLRFGPYLKPPLTTVDQSPYTIGRRAARLLLDRSEGTVPPGDPVKIRLAPKLIVRGSTARAPGAGERFDDRETECVSN
ncbi:MAG: substrate-binding domain-containing protein, partial [Nitrospiraceae bacterium]|nr:substrate-binding domain-containing protein [Nitrospiraceae bacterium]